MGRNLSSIYILMDRRENYLFFLVVYWEERWKQVEREQKGVEESCALSIETLF